jgi:4-aminobutyrate aminotransferase
VERLPYPYCYRCPYSKQYGHCDFECLKELKTLLLADDQVGGVLIEPILGEGGYVPAPVEYIQELRRFTAERGIVLIFDEIQSGFGRTGMLFAKELYDVQPDVMALAKGIASGMPLGACVASAELMDNWTMSAHGGTFLGNPLSCAAGIATLSVIESQQLLENAYHVGQYAKGLLEEAQSRYPVMGDVRGSGLMIGIEFVQPGTKIPNPELVLKIRQVAQERGLLLISCGEEGQVIRLIPPLTISKDEMVQGINIILDIIRENT